MPILCEQGEKAGFRTRVSRLFSGYSHERLTQARRVLGGPGKTAGNNILDIEREHAERTIRRGIITHNRIQLSFDGPDDPVLINPTRRITQLEVDGYITNYAEDMLVTWGLASRWPRR